jgi:hypothetical protein
MRTLKSLSAIVMLGLTLFLNTGCSAFRSSTQTMNITASPTDSILMVNGSRYTPPAQIKVRRDRDVSIQCYKEGYIPYQRTIGYHMNGTGAADIIGTVLFLLPGVGLFCPGAYSLDETDVGVSLYQK